MTRALNAVRRTFWAVLACNAILVLSAIPVLSDGPRTGALAELRAFAARFDVRAQQQAVVSNAQNRADTTWADIASGVGGRGVKKVAAAEPGAVLGVQVEVHLDTLAEIRSMGSPDAAVPVTGPDPEQIAESLRWRLARSGGARRFELVGLEWSAGGAGKEALALERGVEPVRVLALDNRKEFLKADRARERAFDVLDLRRKRRASRKRINKAWNEWEAARDRAAELRESLEQSREAYRGQADRAEAFSPSRAADSSRDDAGLGVVVARIVRYPGATELTARFPVSVKTRPVPVPPVPAEAFYAVNEAGLWEEVKDKSPPAAIAAVAGGYSWHSRGFDVGDTRLGGPTLLQIVPALLSVLCALLAILCRRARAKYHPFHSEGGDFPRIGFGSNLVDGSVLIGLSLMGSVFSVWSLLLIGSFPLGAAFFSPLAIGVAIWCGKELSQLRSLCEDIRRVSVRPSAPYTGTGAGG